LPPDPLILAFDTSAAHCAAALLSGGRLLSLRIEPMKRGQAERLFPLLAAELDRAGRGWGDLAALGVGTGPGNFTGIRIAVSAARGLALARGIPAVGVSGFAALARAAGDGDWAVIPAPRDMAHVQDLRRPAAGPRQMPMAEARALPGRVLHQGDLPLAARIEAVARIAAEGFADAPPRPAPLYVRPPDAAPASAPPPPMLP